MSETALDKDLAAFRGSKEDLEKHHMNKWVLFHEGKLVDIFTSSEEAASEAVKKFGRGPYLIRQVGAPSITLPASVLFSPSYAAV